MIYEMKERANAASVFGDWKETIIWSCVQGVMQVFEFCKKQEWCRDLVSQFSDYDTYQELGLGVMIMEKGIPVSGASSYSSYLGGIEIEIDTKEEYRRQGLASVCGAWLILKCLDKNIYPSWDAQNMWSVALAEKLGYKMDYEYDAYEIWGY